MQAKAMTVNRSTRYEDLPELLSVEEFCAYTQLGKSTVYDLIRRSELEHRRFGRIIRIPRCALGRR